MNIEKGPHCLAIERILDNVRVSLTYGGPGGLAILMTLTTDEARTLRDAVVEIVETFPPEPLDRRIAA